MGLIDKENSDDYAVAPDFTPHNLRVVSFYEQRYLKPRVLSTRGVPPHFNHFGFWDEQTSNNVDALTNMERVLAERVSLQPGYRVLDAGCGFGGSAIWLAKALQVEVVGITLVPGQVEYAQRLADKQGVSHLVRFEQEDFIRTSFPDRSFDVVWAVESVAHTPEKEGFVTEAYRLLKSGGQLIVADTFRKKRPFDASGEKLIQKWCSGQAVPDLATAEEFGDAARKAGFTQFEMEDVTTNILPSVWQTHRRTLLRGYPLALILRILGLRTDADLADIRAILAQDQAVKRGLWFYGIFVAGKSTT